MFNYMKKERRKIRGWDHEKKNYKSIKGELYNRSRIGENREEEEHEEGDGVGNSYALMNPEPEPVQNLW